MLGKRLTGLEKKALSLKYVMSMSDTAIDHELRHEGYKKAVLIPLPSILCGALRKLKTGGLDDFKMVVATWRN